MTTIDPRLTGDEVVYVEGPGEPVHRPIWALDKHMDMLRWLNTDAAIRARNSFWMLYYANKAQIQRYGSTGLRESIPDRTPNAQEALGVELETLNRAQTLYTTTNMSKLAQLIADDMPVRPLRSTDLWAPEGLIIFDDEGKLPYFTPDGPDDTFVPARIRALAWKWTEVGHFEDQKLVPGLGVRLFMYADYDDIHEYLFEEARDPSYTPPLYDAHDHGPWILIDSTSWAVDTTWESLTDLAGLAQAGGAPNNFDTVAKLNNGFVDKDDHVHLMPHVTFVRKWLVAYWHLLDEEIAVVKSEKVPRPAQKRALRLGRIPDDGDKVRVIRLRRVVDIDNQEPVPMEDMAKMWSHQWTVRPHWRHLYRGQGILGGVHLLLDDARAKYLQAGHVLRLTDIDGRRERVEIAESDNGLVTLKWAPLVYNGEVEVERLSYVREHRKGEGFHVERYDVISVER